MEQFIEAFDTAADAHACAITFLPYGFNEWRGIDDNHILYDVADPNHSMWYYYDTRYGTWILFECFEN